MGKILDYMVTFIVILFMILTMGFSIFFTITEYKWWSLVMVPLYCVLGTLVCSCIIFGLEYIRYIIKYRRLTGYITYLRNIII